MLRSTCSYRAVPALGAAGVALFAIGCATDLAGGPSARGDASLMMPELDDAFDENARHRTRLLGGSDLELNLAAEMARHEDTMIALTDAMRAGAAGMTVQDDDSANFLLDTLDAVDDELSLHENAAAAFAGRGDVRAEADRHYERFDFLLSEMEWTLAGMRRSAPVPPITGSR